MITVEELTTQYSSYTDPELYELHRNLGGYSEEAAIAAKKIIEQRGGLDGLKARVEAHDTRLAEKARIEWEVKAFSRKGVDGSFLKSTIRSKILSEEQVHGIIDTASRQLNIEAEDKKIKPPAIVY